MNDDNRSVCSRGPAALGRRRIAKLGAVLLIAAGACGEDGRPRPSSPGVGSGGTSAGAGQGGSSGAGALAGSAGAGIVAGASGDAGSAGGGGPVAPSCIPREGCQRLCNVLGADPAACGFGDVEQCGCLCEDRFNGPCPEELAALLACTGDAPALDCAARGRVFAGCESESLALEVCDFRAREQLCARAFPECMAYCTGLTLSFCPLGPDTVTSCLCGCEATLAVTCPSELAAFMTCAGGAPSFACDEAGLPAPASCAAEWQVLDACARAPRPDAG